MLMDWMASAWIVSRISVRGTSTDVHVEIIPTRIEASNSMPSPVARTVIDDRGLEDGKGVERVNQSSSAGYRRIRKRARASRRASSARTPPAA